MAFYNALVSNIKAMEDTNKCSSLIYVIEKTNDAVLIDA